jgi:hypothetical protein
VGPRERIVFGCFGQNKRFDRPGLGWCDAKTPHALGSASVLHAKNNVHNTLHFTEPLRIEVVGDLDVFVFRSGDLESEACGCELNKSQADVASVGIVIVGLNVADVAVIVFKLTLNDKIWVIGPRQIKVIVAGRLAIERDLEVFAAGLSDRYVLGVEPQWGGLSSDIQSCP